MKCGRDLGAQRAELRLREPPLLLGDDRQLDLRGDQARRLLNDPQLGLARAADRAVERDQRSRSSLLDDQRRQHRRAQAGRSGPRRQPRLDVHAMVRACARAAGRGGRPGAPARGPRPRSRAPRACRPARSPRRPSARAECGTASSAVRAVRPRRRCGRVEVAACSADCMPLAGKVRRTLRGAHGAPHRRDDRGKPGPEQDSQQGDPWVTAAIRLLRARGRQAEIMRRDVLEDRTSLLRGGRGGASLGGSRALQHRRRRLRSSPARPARDDPRGLSRQRSGA